MTGAEIVLAQAHRAAHRMNWNWRWDLLPEATKLRLLSDARADVLAILTAPVSDCVIEAMARGIEPGTFDLPRINLYRDDYECATNRARAASAARVEALVKEINDAK